MNLTSYFECYIYGIGLYLEEEFQSQTFPFLAKSNACPQSLQ
jgi:hypothetical protein